MTALRLNPTVKLPNHESNFDWLVRMTALRAATQGAR